MRGATSLPQHAASRSSGGSSRIGPFGDPSPVAVLAGYESSCNPVRRASKDNARNRIFNGPQQALLERHDGQVGLRRWGRGAEVQAPQDGVGEGERHQVAHSESPTITS